MYACMLATTGQSRDGRSVPGFHGYSDIGIHMYACMLATIGQSRDGHSVPGFRGYSDLGVHLYVGYLGTILGWIQCPGILWIL